MKPIILLFTLVIIVSSCQKSSTGGGSVPVAASTLLNYSYGADPLQKMDIYLPEGRSTATTKLLIMVHGGAWTQGDKSEFTPYVDTLKRRLPGYAIIKINYRLATGTINFFPTQEQLGLEERIQRFDMAQHFGAAELTMLSHQGG